MLKDLLIALKIFTYGSALALSPYNKELLSNSPFSALVAESNENSNPLIADKNSDTSVTVEEPVPDKSGSFVFQQEDPLWADIFIGYNSDKTEEWGLGTAGCGQFTIINAIYYKFNYFIEPEWIADYTIKNNYFLNGAGTYHSFFRGIIADTNSQFGLVIYNSSNDYGKDYKIKNVPGYFQDTNFAFLIAHMANRPHFVAIVDCKDDKYLMLDSAAKYYEGETAPEGPEPGFWLTYDELVSGPRSINWVIPVYFE